MVREMAKSRSIIQRFSRVSVRNFNRAVVAASLLALGQTVCVSAEDDHMQLGMEDYDKRNFSDAIGHFGAVLSTNYNSANLHYLMANCFVHLHQRESAIREYRIAFALAPTRGSGNYSSMCLRLFGIDAEGKISTVKDKGAKQKGDKLDWEKNGESGQSIDSDEPLPLKKDWTTLEKQADIHVRNYPPIKLTQSVPTFSAPPCLEHRPQTVPKLAQPVATTTPAPIATQVMAKRDAVAPSTVKSRSFFDPFRLFGH